MHRWVRTGFLQPVWAWWGHSEPSFPRWAGRKRAISTRTVWALSIPIAPPPIVDSSAFAPPPIDQPLTSSHFIITV